MRSLSAGELYVCLPPDHPLAGCASVTFEMLNGYNCLLRSEIGFWDAMSRRKMPASASWCRRRL